MVIYELYKKYIGKSLVLKVAMSIFSILVFYFLTRNIRCKSFIKCETINIALLSICIIIDYIFNKLFVIKKEMSRNKYVISTIIFIVANTISLLLLFIFVSKHLVIKYVLSYIIALIAYKISLVKINKNIDMVKTINIIFVSLFFFVLALGTYSIIGEKENKSNIENRELNQFVIPSVDTFKNKTYQSNLENSLADQVMYGLKIKELTNKYLNFLDYKKINSNICKNRYVYLSSGYATYNCSDQIVAAPKSIDNTIPDMLQKIDVLSHVNDLVDTYYYTIDRSYTINFEKKDYTFNVKKFLVANLKGDYKIKSFEIESYDDYYKYFYKTDHHWNYIGSYKGYKEIHDLLDIDEDYVEPTGVKTASKKFYGSHAKGSKMLKYGEEFKYYTYEYDEHSTYLNGQKGLYTNPNRKTKESYVNYYELIYGKDGIDLQYNFKQPKKDNLLIIATSFSNPINEMIASHFNKTYVIDLRKLRNDSGSPVNLRQYIRWHDIDKVLVIVSTDLINNSQLKMEWID